MESPQLEFVETNRLDWLKRHVVNLAPELEIEEDPDYFSGKQLVERYHLLALEIDQISKYTPGRHSQSNQAFETPKIIFGYVQEYDRSWPISLSFTAGPNRQWPSYLCANWRVQQFDAHSRRLYQDRLAGNQSQDGSDLMIVSTNIINNRVALDKVSPRRAAWPHAPEEAAQLNSIARSVESYHRLMEEWSVRRSRAARPARQDAISESIGQLLSYYPEEFDEEIAWPQF